jgi:hypothetical protein
MAINGYVKVVGLSNVLSKVIDVPPEATEDGSGKKSVAVPGFIKFQDYFFFDSRNPESSRDAVDAARRFSSTRVHDVKHPPKLSIYNRPTFAGPWDEIESVGQGFDGTKEVTN